MNKCNIPEKIREQITAKAGLVVLGVKVRQLGILKPIEDEVKIAQKTVKYTPHEKLTDALIAIVSGAAGLVEVNKRVRSDSALQLAFRAHRLRGAVSGTRYAGCLHRAKCYTNATGGR